MYYNIFVARSADVTQWQSVRFPSRIRGFDSRHPLQIPKGTTKVVPFGISIASPNQSPASPTERLYVRSRRIGDYRHMKTHVWVLIPVIQKMVGTTKVVPFGISIASPNQSPASPTERLYVRSRRIGDYRHMKTHVWVLIPVIRAFAVLPCGKKSLRNFYISEIFVYPT